MEILRTNAFYTREKWQKLLRELDYQEYQSTSSFSRFRFKDLAAWPIDLMYVASNLKNYCNKHAKAELFDRLSVDLNLEPADRE